MMDLPLEHTANGPENSTQTPEKEATLAWLFPEALRQEIEAIAESGYEITIGSTEDYAYESPEAIKRIFNRLHEGGEALARESRQTLLGGGALVSTIEYDLRSRAIFKYLKSSKNPLIARAGKVRDRLNTRREELRAKYLYEQPDVMAQSWHEQGGRALALATIVDAHDLRVIGRDDGTYDTMSGRLDVAFGEDFVFPSGSISESLAGRRLGDVASEEELAKLKSFMVAPVYDGFKDIVAYCTDSLGIRGRKEEVRTEINRYVDVSQKDSFLMMSVGCGTALPILEVMKDVQEKGRDAKMILVDQDHIALAAAYQFAKQMGLEESVEIHQAQLFVGKGRATHLMDLQDVLQGRKLDICEDSGLREYFPDSMYEDLTRQAWDALVDGGLMTTGNMNKNRPQAEFLHGLMGWPVKVQMRNIRDITRLHQKAGIPTQASRLRVTQDGVYTLCFSLKEEIS